MFVVVYVVVNVVADVVVDVVGQVDSVCHPLSTVFAVL
jgi:hypothetical protein